MKILKCLCIGLFLCSIYASSAQQISTDSSSSLEALIQANLGQGCVDISNITSSVNGQFSGISSYGTFDKADSNFPIENGIVLSTGSINSSGNGINSNTLNEGTSNWPTDSDLENVLELSGTLNATSIEFDFISVANQIEFNYVLASEEYNTNFPCQYTDHLAFLIKETGSSLPYKNIAVIPDTPEPANTNKIHPEIVGFCAAENEQYFGGYNVGDTNFNGRTNILTASIEIIPNVQYHIKLIIADQGDQNYDSAVFIQGTTNTIATVNLGPDINTCGESLLIDGNIQNNLAEYQWFLDGVLIADANDATYLATGSGTYSVEINLQINDTACSVEDDIIVSLNSEQDADLIPDFTLCDDQSNDGFEIFDLATKDSDVINAVPAGNYNISYHLTNVGALTGTATITVPIQNSSNLQTIYVRIEEMDTGCLAFSTFNIVVNNSPIFTEPSDIIICDDDVADGITVIDLEATTIEITAGTTNLFVSYHYTQNDASLNQNEILPPYLNTNVSEILFIRIQDIITGCVTTTSINIEVLENPIINQDTHWITACETDDDGFETFNLTLVINDILQGLTGVSVNYYETLTDAQSGTNPIANITSYQNITPNFQRVYVRITNDTTGCYTIEPIELHTSITQSGFDINPFGICDDATNDGIADFSLIEVELALLNSYEDFTVTFFQTENDQLNNINPLDTNIPFTTNTIITLLYVTVESVFCTEYTTTELVIHPAIEIQDLEAVEYCDNDFDGFTSILLESFDSYVSTGIDFPSVRYYLTENDAVNNENVLPGNYINTINPITVYTRVTNTETGCFDTSSLQIEVIDPPVVMLPTNIVICDDNQDGIYIVDLVSKIPEIVANTIDLDITFYTNIDEAIDGINPILTPENYSTATTSIYAKVVNTITTCYSIIGFDIYVNTLPVFIPISNFITCENDEDGINDFYFNLKDNEILNGQLGKQTLYFETAQDAIDRTNIIDKNLAYQNLSNPQTIHVRVENLTDIDCFGTSSLVINVTPFPLFNSPIDFDLCDDISNDGFEVFDLNQKVTEISNGIPENLDISFHLSFDDADLDLNELPLNYTNIVNPQQLFVRIENGSFCYSITDFNVGVIQVPEVSTAPDLINCDVDYDGITTFNLIDVEIDVLDIRQDNLVVSYHETLVGTETDTDIISDPENYNNISNPQIVYIKVNNTISNCYSVLPINLYVNLPPLINEFESYEICTNPTSSFDLNAVNDIIVDDDTDVQFSYYESFTNAQSSSNSLDANYTYITTNDTVFIRVEFSTTGCFYIYPFQLIVNPLPIANQPIDLQACDDDFNDGIEVFNLFSVNNAVLGTQDANEFTITYFNSELEANLGTNPVSYNYTGQDGETLYVRIENNTTGCFSLTQFDLIVNNHPNEPSAITNCDTDYDSITSFDLTQSELELFDSVNPDNLISYFESIEDLQNDVNVISDPIDYNNLFSPQTVYIKVFNTVANCFTFVSLELNVNLPPAINPLDTFEVCANETATLSDINSHFLLQTANVIVVYYPTELDALNQSNPLDNEYEYQSTSDTIFARVEFSTTHCYHIHEFDLIINPNPIANTPDDLVECDDNYDNLFTFDLSSQNAMVLNEQNPNEFTVTYYNYLLSAEDGIDTLDIIYEAIYSETIYVRLENNTTGCYDITSFDVIIHPKPVVDIGNQLICLDDLPLIVNANTNQAGDTYLWSTNQTTPEIEIIDIGTYSVTVTSPIGCETTEYFTVTESEAASIIITESIDFSDPNNVIVTINGIGNYLYQLDDDEPQLSNVFENVGLGYHILTIIDLNGCASVTKEIVVIDAPKFMTPNDDGRFDTWHITGVETLPGTIIYIFDRYGKLLKTLTSNSSGWNGFYNGSLMPVSDYWYLAKVRKEGNAFEVKGHFSLRY